MAQPAVNLDSPHGEIKFIALADMIAGHVYALGARFVYIDQIAGYATGDLAKGVTAGSFIGKKALADVFALDADVFFETATGSLKTATGTGIIGPIGKCNSAVGNGDDEVRFELNRS